MRKSRKDDIVEAATWLVARNGPGGATTRAIAQRAGVTEGAIYRHFPSKDELMRHIHARFLGSMTEVKDRIAGDRCPFHEKVHAWVRTTYRYFDEHRDAFTFVFLTQHTDDSARDMQHEQERVFSGMIRQAQANGECSGDLTPEMCMCHFAGIMLNIPRNIVNGVMPGEASDYVDEATRAICTVLGVAPDPHGRFSPAPLP